MLHRFWRVWGDIFDNCFWEERSGKSYYGRKEYTSKISEIFEG